MSMWKDSQRAALKTEEAALLAALPRSTAQGAALQSVLRSARRMEEMRVRSVEQKNSAAAARAQQTSHGAAAQGKGSRAALRQVWTRP